jgi:glycosyltransferase involved in cell wall biosynthesis
LKLFEYLALGKAIIAPIADNIMEVLEDKTNAILFESGNIDSLEDSLTILINDTKLREKLGRNARRTIEENGYTWEGNAHTVSEIASNYINRHSQ